MIGFGSSYSQSVARSLRQRALVVCAVALAAGALALVSPAIAGAADLGFKGPNTSGNSNPTAEKPESKLWFNDGIWWGALWDSASPRGHEIFRLDTGTQTWTSTNVAIDSRATHVDALWDGTKLYVASHIFTTSPKLGGPSNLYRYSYNAATDTYTLDPGFPAVINSQNTEALVIDKDSLGNLWATWMRANQIWVSHTSGNDAVWGTPFVLPTTDAGSVDSDDMSSLIAFNGQIGVMYSDQTDNNMHFAVHVDGAADSAWTHENAYGPQTNCPATSCADDHINLKAFGGKVYAATKTSLGGSSPLTNLLVRDTNGSWSAHVFGTAVSTQDHTRPIVLIDGTSGVVHMFATGSAPGSTTYDLIYEKTSPLSNISFPTGAGTPFIDPDGSTPSVNNATSTKQNLTSDMGLVVISSGGSNYWHNSVQLVPDTTPPVIQSAVANGSTLTMTYNELLNTASVPAIGDIAVNGGHSVTGVNVTGATVVLTLSPAVIAGETGLTLSYTKGASPIEDIALNDAENLVTFAVTNSTGGGGGGSPTLLPNGDISTSNLGKTGGTSFSDAIDDTIAAADDASTYINNTGTTGSNFVSQLTDTPGGFTSMSALTIDIRARTTSRTDDNLTLLAQVFRSDGTTPLTNEITVAINPGTSNFATISGVAFTGVVPADKATWDAARLKLRWAYAVVGSPDSGAKLKLTAAQLNATGASGPDITSPVFQSAAVNGTTLTMTYNEALNTGSVPANGDFAISGGHSVTGRNVTGSTVVLTLSPAVVNGETITLSYTEGTNPIEDLAGNDASQPRQLRRHEQHPTGRRDAARLPVGSGERRDADDDLQRGAQHRLRPGQRRLRDQRRSLRHRPKRHRLHRRPHPLPRRRQRRDDHAQLHQGHQPDRRPRRQRRRQPRQLRRHQQHPAAAAEAR